MKHEFDKFAKEYRTAHSTPLAATGESSTFFAQYKAEKLAEWLPEFFTEAPKKILDFGCGDGLMTHFVKQQFPTAQVYGVDPSSESIAIAQQNYPDLSFYVSGETLSFFEENTFDVIYTAGVFHHIPFSEHEHYTKELNRILKPSGVLIVFELNPLNPGTQYIFRNAPMDANATMLTPWYTQKLLKPYGKPKLKFYSFFPHFLKGLRCTEKFLTKVPLGGLYASLLKKDFSKK